MPSLEVCFRPEDFGLYKTDNQCVVIIDVLRATSVICTALSEGVKAVIPVKSEEEAARFIGKEGFICAGERDAIKIEGFDLGNSPLAFLEGSYAKKKLVLTTTNGTRAAEVAKISTEMLAGSLLNAEAICRYLAQSDLNIVLLCSGWKGKVNLEDCICAGYMADALKSTGYFKSKEDSTLIAENLFRSARNNPISFLKGSSHRRRLLKLGLSDDIKYCLTSNILDVIPIFKNGEFVKL